GTAKGIFTTITLRSWSPCTSTPPESWSFPTAPHWASIFIAPGTAASGAPAHAAAGQLQLIQNPEAPMLQHFQRGTLSSGHDSISGLGPFAAHGSFHRGPYFHACPSASAGGGVLSGGWNVAAGVAGRGGAAWTSDGGGVAVSPSPVCSPTAAAGMVRRGRGADGGRGDG